MKKLQLKLEGKAMLSKEQMKNIQGGYASCAALCSWGAVVCWYEETPGYCWSQDGVGCTAEWVGGTAHATC